MNNAETMSFMVVVAEWESLSRYDCVTDVEVQYDGMWVMMR